MESNLIIPDLKYCLVHSREVLTRPISGRDCHNENNEELPCQGPFTYCPPPPSLTEEEWGIILEEGENGYAS